MRSSLPRQTPKWWFHTLYDLGEPAEPDFTFIDAAFVDGPELLGYALEPAEVEPGGVVYLTLRWQAPAPLAADYTVFTHLLSPAGELIAQSDSQPVGGTRPTTTWAVGEEIIDRYALLVPAGTPAGDYTVQVGLYDWRTGVRLPLDAHGAPEHLILGTIRTVP